MDKKHIDFEGFKFDIDMDIFDDVKFYELADTIEAKPSNNIDILKMGLGDKYADFEAFFTKKDGRLKMSKVMQLVAVIFETAGPKDSASGSSKNNTPKN